MRLTCRLAALLSLVNCAAPDDPGAPAPTITAVSPPLGDVLGGARVTVTGARLGGAAITIGGAPCAPIVTSDDAITCVAPALAPGRWDVVARDDGGAGTVAGAYEAWSPAQIPGAQLWSASSITPDRPLEATLGWETVTCDAPWHARDGAGLVWFAERLWMLGGWHSPAVWGDAYTTNEVWVSDDLGDTWSLALAHEPAPPQEGPGARWTPRHTVGFLPLQVDGTDFLYVVGGDIYAPVGDVWRSTDGLTWKQVAAHTPWEGRVLQMVGALDGALYVMGGQDTIADPATARADVWRSWDGGITWEALGDAPWGPRGMVYDLVAFKGALWLAGGGTYDDDGPRTFYNDVWRFDGTTWMQVTDAAPWAPREYHNVWVFDGELWVGSGYDGVGNRNDLWHSPDGRAWTRAATPPFLPGHGDGMAVTSAGLVHATGNAMDRCVHRTVPSVTATISQWTDVAGDTPLTGAATLVTGAFGDLPGVSMVGGDQLTRSTWAAQPDGRAVLWVGATRRRVGGGWVNPGMTVVGDSRGSCRAQAGYTDNGLEYVVTDATGSWADGHVRPPGDVVDGAPHLVGFLHGVDGVVTPIVDGIALAPTATTYDGPYMGWDTVGAGFAGDNPADVTLGFVVVVTGPPTDADLEKTALFARKWTDPR